jgi:hypothetical protein
LSGNGKVTTGRVILDAYKRMEFLFVMGSVMISAGSSSGGSAAAAEVIPKDVSKQPIRMHAKVLEGRISVKEFEGGHALAKQKCFSCQILLDLIADQVVVQLVGRCGGARIMIVIAVDGLSKLLNRFLVEDCSEATVGNGKWKSTNMTQHVGTYTSIER